MLKFLFLFLFLLKTHASITQISLSVGSFQVKYLYNSTSYSNSRIVLAKYDLTTKLIWFVAVADTSTTTNIACRRISQSRIVVGPNGCSNIQNPQLALQSANCIPNQVDVELRRAIFKETWYLSKTSNECFFKGGNGDIRLCMGPLRLAQDNVDSFIPHSQDWPSAKELLSARMAFVDGLVGPYAMSLTIVEVPLIFPSLYLTINSGTFPGYGGQGYINWENDPYLRQITDVWKSFKGAVVSANRILLKRVPGLTEVNFYIVLASSVGSGGGYTYEYRSAVQTTTLESGSLLILQNWVEFLPFDVEIPMYNYTSGVLVGAVTISINSPPSKFLLEDIYPTTPNNYSLNINPRRYWGDNVCGYRNGFLTATGELRFPNCLAEDKCGGDATYVYPEFPNLPIGLPPDPTLDYDLSCARFYPFNETFEDDGINGVDGRATISRMGFVQELCYAPFIAPEIIRLNVNPNEKFLQCQKLGAQVVGASQTACARPITQLLCKLGWYYFDQKCFYKFNPTTETQYASPINDGVQKCAQLNPYALLLIEVDEYLQQWLLNFYLYEDRDLNNFASYRIPQYRSDQCTCYTTRTYTVSPTCSCFGIKDEFEVLTFPICYYPITTAELEPRYAGVGVSLQTARLWRYGQTGPLPSGFEARCVCFDGWTGKGCERASCPVANLIVDDPANALTVTKFFGKCYTDMHGACFNGQPRVCQCNYGFAPHASIIPNFPLLYQFRDFPCACPAAPGAESLYYQINTVIYNNTNINDVIPCSGVENGVCLTTNSSVSGTCACVTRTNVLTGSIEPSFDGNRCGCERPIQPFGGDTKNGLIVAALCNYKGVCCPGGQSVINPLIGNLYDASCFDSITGAPVTGCSCFNGYGGESCTCPVPLDLAYNRFKEQKIYGNNIFIFVDLGQKYIVNYINVSNCVFPSFVQISNSPGVDSSSTTCVYNGTIRYFVCEPSEAKQFIVLPATTSVQCTIKAYERIFQFCGANHTVSNFAGRFFAIPAYRSNSINLLQQPLTMSSFGCTNTDCMCNSNYGGQLCAARVSSIRETTIFYENEIIPVQAKVFCGETLSVPNIDNPVEGSGSIDPYYLNCTCSEISSVDATGRIGRTRQNFAGEACTCATGYNENFREIYMCTKHGTCVEPSMPEGFCEADLDKYQADSLFTPFIVITDVNVEFSDIIFEEDSIFYYDVFFDVTEAPTPEPTKSPTPPTLAPTKTPTKNPTKNPTSHPTKNPTKKPTSSPTKNPTKKPSTNPTINPTRSPTQKPIVFYTIPTPLSYTSGGALGNRATTTARCISALSSFPYDLIGCVNTFQVLSYSGGDDIQNMPTNFAFDPNLQILGYDSSGVYTELAPTWTYAFSTGLTNSLATAGLLSTGNLFWTGGLTGTTNCNDWTTNSGAVNGNVGLAESTSSTWYTNSDVACSIGRFQICACTRQGTPPTPSPTSPEIFVFNIPSGIRPTNGILGNRATTSARCATAATSLSLTCSSTFQFLSYSGGDNINNLQTNFGIPASTAVKSYFPPNDILATDWNAFITTDLTKSLFASGAMDAAGDYFTGGFTGANNCNDWTYGTFPTYSVTVGTTNSKFYPLPIERTTDVFCGLALQQMCVCLQ